ncbi:RNA polymerase sigma-54 factor [Opitutaceae bacterium TAV4]|nr:RNA polymerase sigma-54 factor [Opitutaceae bacterium TAV4]RRJ99784.1 RNA polymerase sigma-54 factor [Opitutaceae bacterium TAV3]
MSGPSFSHELRQKQTQSLVLAPQLRQSLKILQVAALDLRSVIQEELESNPTLEELSGDTVSLEHEREKLDAGDRADDSGGGNDDDGGNLAGDDGAGGDYDRGAGNAPAERDSDSDAAGDRESLDFSKEFEVLSKLDEDWRDYMSQAGGNQPYTSEDAERRQHFFDSLVSETSLQEHLMRQAELSDHAPHVRDALEHLIGGLDERGFATQTPSEVALQTGLPLDAVQEAARLLKTFEPAGIGAADLGECLLLQLRAKGRGDSLAARIVRDHMALLTRRRIPEIARKSGAHVDDVQEAILEIGALDPAPGRRFAEDTNRVVTPDVTVEKDDSDGGESADGGWRITLNSDYIPRLRISNTYRDLIARGTLNKQERDYLRERIRSGKFLINSIEQRQQTIERITREILKVQREFFEEGVSKLRPLTMTQIASAVGVHETTVSRAIANKFIQTPHGVFEMKYFFTPGYASSGGESVSNTSVKEMISDLIAGEDRSHPLSDEEIVKKLSGKGIKIARRTVAKYREELGLLPSNLRREYS